MLWAHRRLGRLTIALVMGAVQLPPLVNSVRQKTWSSKVEVVRTSPLA
jgi:hypothetical protein